MPIASLPALQGRIPHIESRRERESMIGCPTTVQALCEDPTLAPSPCLTTLPAPDAAPDSDQAQDAALSLDLDADLLGDLIVTDLPDASHRVLSEVQAAL